MDISTLTKTMATESASGDPQTYHGPTSPYKKMSCTEVNFCEACTVIDSWDKVRDIPNWECVAGEIFLRRLFDISPQLKELWGFGKSTEPIDPVVYKQESFINKGVALLLAVDKAVAMLGPNLEPLEDELFALGRRHIHMKAEPEFWPLVGDALMFTLHEGLGNEFADYEEGAWNVIYNFLSYWMIEGLLAEKKDRWEAKQHECLEVPKKSPKRQLEEDDTAPSLEESNQQSHSDSTSSSRRSSLSSTSSRRLSIPTKEADINDNVYDPVPADAIKYGTVQLVMDSWQMVTNIPNWLEISSVLVLCKLFELRPEIKVAWGFAPDFDPDNLSDPNHNKFIIKGLGFMAGVDKALAFLGPDLEPLSYELVDLGRIHYVHMAAEPQFWPPVGVALMDTLDKVLGDKLTDDMKEAWETLYSFMAYWMIEGLLLEKHGN